jgi:hypothetical protein
VTCELSAGTVGEGQITIASHLDFAGFVISAMVAIPQARRPTPN